MTDEELVKRLRANTSWGDDRFAEAADRIEALSDRIEGLEENQRFIIRERDRTFALMLARTEKAEAERDRLREALTRLLAPFGNDACHYDHHGYCQEHFIEADCCVAHARAALKGETP